MQNCLSGSRFLNRHEDAEDFRKESRLVDQVTKHDAINAEKNQSVSETISMRPDEYVRKCLNLRGIECSHITGVLIQEKQGNE